MGRELEEVIRAFGVLTEGEKYCDVQTVFTDSKGSFYPGQGGRRAVMQRALDEGFLQFEYGTDGYPSRVVRTDKPMVEPTFRAPPKNSTWPYTRVHHKYLMKTCPVRKLYNTTMQMLTTITDRKVLSTRILEVVESLPIVLEEDLNLLRRRALLTVTGKYRMPDDRFFTIVRLPDSSPFRYSGYHRSFSRRPIISLDECLAALLVEWDAEEEKFRALPPENQLDAVRKAREARLAREKK